MLRSTLKGEDGWPRTSSTDSKRQDYQEDPLHPVDSLHPVLTDKEKNG
jgi:hypothetical protein